MYEPVEVSGLRVVDVLALLGDGGCVVSGTLTLRGLQRVIMALQVHMARGQQHVIRARYLHTVFLHLGAKLIRIGMFAGFGWGGHVGHLDVWDAFLPQDERRVGLLHLLHVVDGYGSIKGLLPTKIGGLKRNV